MTQGRRGRIKTSEPQLPHTLRSLATVVTLARSNLTESQARDIVTICERVKHEATAAEWLLWGDQNVKDGVRAALRARSTDRQPVAVNLNGEYLDPRQFVFPQFVQWAYERAMDGREMYDKVQEIAQLCLLRTGRSFDPDVVIGAVSTGEPIEALLARLRA